MLSTLRRYTPRQREIRTLAGAAFVDSVGAGLFLAMIPVFVIQEVGVPAGWVGPVVGAASLLGLVSPMPAGRLADRYGDAVVWSALLIARAACYAGFLLVDTFLQYAVITCLCGLFDRASSTVQQAYVVRLVTADGRTEAMAALRTARNVGLSAGLLGAGVLITIGTRDAFLAGFAVNAVSYLVLLAAVRRVERHRPPVVGSPDTPPGPGGRSPRVDSPTPLRDRRYLLFSIGNSIVMLHDSVLFTLLPLWIITRTDLPRGVVGPLLALNTILTVLLQVPMSRWVRGVDAACRTTRRAAVPLIGACALFAGAELVPSGWGLVVVAAAVVLLTIGENMHTVAAFELAHRLAPERAAGRYLGLFNVGVSAQLAFGPPVMTGLVLRGTFGWAGLAVAFAAGIAALIAGSTPTRRYPHAGP